MTGSTTRRVTRWARTRSATAWMIAAVESIPVLTASAPMSPRTASSWRATNSGGRFTTPWTPIEFWAVMAVRTEAP